MAVRAAEMSFQLLCVLPSDLHTDTHSTYCLAIAHVLQLPLRSLQVKMLRSEEITCGGLEAFEKQASTAHCALCCV